MIPKVIHYCWLSDNPYPKDIQCYLKSWEEHLKGYEFVKWDFSRFPKDKCAWVSEAFDCKKYAFAADYLRLFALYNYGGIYLDTDVECYKSFDAFLSLKTMVCYENHFGKDPERKRLEVAAFGAAKGEQWVLECLKYYDDRHFIKDNGEFDMKTLPDIVHDVLLSRGYIYKSVSSIDEALSTKDNEIPVFPFDYFCPKNLYTFKVMSTKNTCCVHNFKGSWSPQPARSFLLKIGFNDYYAAKLIGLYQNVHHVAHLIKSYWRKKWSE